MTDARTTREAGGRDELDRAQRGDRHAFLSSYQHHAPLTWRLSLVAGRDPMAAEAAVVSSFARVLGRADRRDIHRFAPVDAQLLRSAREAAIEQADRLEAPAGLDVVGSTSHPDTLRAFDRLPERWRTVLWLDQIERLPLSTTAVVLGATEQSAAGLTTRALAGLREQVAQGLVVDGTPEHCRYSTNRLAGYATRALPSRDTIRVRRHLDRCEACRSRLDDLDDVTPHLRGTLPVLPLAVESLALGAWLARSREGAGPLGLHLPNGLPAPAWVERSLAGATAAVVSLGITAAVLLSRGGSNPVPAESAIATSEGEQALQGSDAVEEGATDGPATVIDVSSPSFDDPAIPASPTGGTDGGNASAPPAGLAETPRGGSAPSTPSSPAPTGPTPAPAPSDPTAPPAPPSSDPVDEVVGTVDDVVEAVCGALGPVCDAVPLETPLPPLPGL